MQLARLDLNAEDPWHHPQLAKGAECLYLRSPELEEAHPAWISAADSRDLDFRDVSRVSAALADRWRTQPIDHDGTVAVFGRYRLLDDVEAIESSLHAGFPDGEEDQAVTSLAAAARLLERLPEDWLIPVASAAERYGVTVRVMTKYCLSGRVPGAHKRGKRWWLPRVFEVLPHPERPRARRRRR